MTTNTLNANQILYEKIGSAIVQNDTKLIESMLTSENLANSQNGLNFLTRASELGNNYVLNSLWDIISPTAKQQTKILNEAVSNSQIDTVRFLLEEKSVDVNGELAGTTPLFWAKQIDNSAIVELLTNNIEKNATTLKTSPPLETQLNFNEEDTSYDYSPYIYGATALASISALYMLSCQKNSITSGESSNIVKLATSTISSFNPYNALVKTVSFVSSSIATMTKIFETVHDKATADDNDFAYKLADLSDEFTTKETSNKIEVLLSTAKENVFGDDGFGIFELFEKASNAPSEIIDLYFPDNEFDDGDIPFTSYLNAGMKMIERSQIIDIDTRSELSGDWENDDILYQP